MEIFELTDEFKKKHYPPDDWLLRLKSLSSRAPDLPAVFIWNMSVWPGIWTELNLTPLVKLICAESFVEVTVCAAISRLL